MTLRILTIAPFGSLFREVVQFRSRRADCSNGAVHHRHEAFAFVGERPPTDRSHRQHQECRKPNRVGGVYNLGGISIPTQPPFLGEDDYFRRLTLY